MLHLNSLTTLAMRNVAPTYRVATITVFSFLICVRPAFAEVKATSVSMTDRVGDWVVHEATGRVFATLVEKDEVVEFDSSAKEVRRIKVGAEPGEMIVKRDHLVIACKKSPSLHVFDLKTNQLAGTVSIDGVGPIALFCSQVDNSFVYCISNTGSAWWDGEVFQADIQKFVVRKRVKVQPWGQSHVMNVAMSRDGKWIVPDARGASSPSGADLMKVDEDEATFTQVRDYHDSFGPIVAGPMNRYWIFGNALYSLDITKRMRTFAGSPAAIHPEFDLVASKLDSGIVLERLSDASRIGQLSFDGMQEATATTALDQRRPQPNSFSITDSVVQFDLKHNLIFCGLDSTAVWLKLDDFKDDLVPLKLVQAPSEVQSIVRQPLRVPLPITNADVGPKVSLNIQSGPESAKIENNHFVWTPQDIDVGITTARVDVVSSEGDKILDTAEMTLHVTLPKIELGFSAKMMEVSEDRRYAVLWGPALNQETRHPAHTGPDSIAVVDLKSLEIIAAKELPQGIRCATIDSSYVYIAPNSGNLFYRLSHQLEGNSRQFIQFTPQSLIKIGPEILAAYAGQMALFDTKSLKPVSLDGPKNIHPQGAQAIAAIGQNALQIGPRCFNRHTGEILRLSLPVNLPQLYEGQVSGNALMNQQQSALQWGRQIQGNSIVSHSGSQITSWAGQRTAILSYHWPLAITVASAAQNQFSTTTLEMIDLVDGTKRHSAVIDVSPTNRLSHDFNGMSTRIVEANNQLLVLIGSTLLVANIPESIANSMPQPPSFSLQQTVAIELADTVEIKLNVDGPRENLTFSQLIESPGIELDSKTGQLALKLKNRWNETMKVLAATEGNSVPRSGNQLPTSSRSANATIYKELTGKELPEDKLATYLPISAVLRDSQGQEDALRISVIVVGPRKDLDDAIQALKIDRERQLATMADERQKRQETAMKQAAESQTQDGQGITSLPKRIEALEARVRRLEAAMDTALKKLEEK